MPLNEVNIERAKRAYNAYGSALSFRSSQNVPMSAWDELPPKVQTAWLAAIASIIVTPGTTNEVETTKRPIFQPVEQQVQPVGGVQRNVNSDGTALPRDTRGQVGGTARRPDVQTVREEQLESPRPDGFENIGGVVPECEGFCELPGNVR